MNHLKASCIRLWRKILSRGHEAVNSAPQITFALCTYALMVVLVTASSWAIYKHKHESICRPLFDGGSRFSDLTHYAGKVAHLRGAAAALGSGWPIYNYPAPGAFVYKLVIFSFPGHAVRTYLVFLAICSMVFALITWHAARTTKAVRYSVATAIATTAALGYPLIFTADRGNLEGVVWALSTTGLCFLLRAKYRAAALLIGLAACVKPFAILFLLLLLPRRRYREAALGAVTASLVTIAALTYLGPNPWKAYQELLPGVYSHIDSHIVRLDPYEDARFEHSLLDGMKSAALTVEMGGIRPHKAVWEIPILRDEPAGWHIVRRMARIYPYLAIAGLGLLIAVFYRMPMLNQLTALAAAVTLIPPCSADYTLLAMYLPFGALLVFLSREVAAGKAAISHASLLALAVLYALLFSPLTFLMLYAGDAKLLLLLGLLFVTALTPMPSKYFGDAINRGYVRDERYPLLTIYHRLADVEP